MVVSASPWVFWTNLELLYTYYLNITLLTLPTLPTLLNLKLFYFYLLCTSVKHA